MSLYMHTNIKMVLNLCHNIQAYSSFQPNQEQILLVYQYWLANSEPEL